MLLSKRNLEGYLEIDHKNSPGVTSAQAAQVGRGTIPVPAGTRLQLAVTICPYCETQIIRNPSRTRERAYDRKTDRYICDGCALLRKLNGELKPMKQIIDEWANAAAKAKTF